MTEVQNGSTAVNPRIKLQQLRHELREHLIEREEAIDLTLAALISGGSIFLYGDPGEGKTYLIDLISQSIDAESGYWLFGATTVPDDFIGPVDLIKLTDHKVYERDLEGGLAAVPVFIADECFKSNDVALNAQLGVMNEKRYKNGKKMVECPLQLYAAMSNEMPESSNTRAYYDRLEFRYPVPEVSRKGRELLMMRACGLENTPEVTTTLSLSEVHGMGRELEAVEISKVVIQGSLDIYYERLKQQGIKVSTRKFVKLVNMLRAYAYAQGRDMVTEQDLDILKFIFWEKPEQVESIEKAIVEIRDAFGEQIEKFLNEGRKVIQSLEEPRRKKDKDKLLTMLGIAEETLFQMVDKLDSYRGGDSIKPDDRTEKQEIAHVAYLELRKARIEILNEMAKITPIS